MKIYENLEQRSYYKHKAFLDSKYKKKIIDSLKPGKDNDAMVLTEEFSMISFRTVVEPKHKYNHRIEVKIYGYNVKNLEIREIKPSSRDWVEQKATISINGRLISFKVATADKLFNKYSALNEINFKMRKLLLKL